jgi:hypothetical protein
MTTNNDLVGAPKPDLIAEANRIREELGVGMNGAIQRATEIVRAWAVANGYAE